MVPTTPALSCHLHHPTPSFDHGLEARGRGFLISISDSGRPTAVHCNKAQDPTSGTGAREALSRRRAVMRGSGANTASGSITARPGTDSRREGRREGKGRRGRGRAARPDAARGEVDATACPSVLASSPMPSLCDTAQGEVDIAAWHRFHDRPVWRNQGDRKVKESGTKTTARVRSCSLALAARSNAPADREAGWQEQEPGLLGG